MGVYTVITIFLVIFGSIYLFKRKKKKPEVWMGEIKKRKPDANLTIDESFNLKRTLKEHQLDQLLDKINQKGFSSLSENEKKLLEELSK
ncbi:MAG TPA: DUF6576 domain-containing protein [Edaphocola sp.]|nr:DUF6576 domain-containing protein [Edaphocola sp.]